MVVLFVGDDWAEDHHDVWVMDEAGGRVWSGRLSEGVAGVTRLHEVLADLGQLDAGALLNGRPELLADHVHLSPAGSEVMAQLLADFLAAMLHAPAPAGR